MLGDLFEYVMANISSVNYSYYVSNADSTRAALVCVQ